jgi:hypothetical protein
VTTPSLTSGSFKVIVATPITLRGGQDSPAMNALSVHVGNGVGLPISPGGSSPARSLTSATGCASMEVAGALMLVVAASSLRVRVPVT